MNQLEVKKSKKKNQRTFIIMIAMLLLIVTESHAQINTGQLATKMNNIVSGAFTIISLIVACVGGYMIGNGLIQAIRGDKESWMKVAGVGVIVCIWFFVAPGFIEWMFEQAGVNVSVRIITGAS